MKRTEPEPVVPFETPPGKQMQLDFTHVRRGRDPLIALVATMGYSRATFVKFAAREDAATLCAGLREAFDYFGGVPEHVQGLGIALDRAAQRMAEAEAAPRRRDRKLQHADLQRHQPRRPAAFVGQKHRERREAAVVERPVLEERHVELVGHERAAEVRGEGRIAFDRRQVARAAAFVGDRPARAHAECERGVVVEEELSRCRIPA